MRRRPNVTPEDVAALAAAGESETLELKKSTGSRVQAAKTVCAFLNHRGGRVLFGVRQDGVVVGQQVSDRTVEEISEEIRNIHPQAPPRVERVGGDREVSAVGTDRGIPAAACPSWHPLPARRQHRPVHLHG